MYVDGAVRSRRAELGGLGCRRLEREVGEIEAGEEHRVQHALPGKFARERREAVDVSALPAVRDVRQQVLDVQRAVRVAHQLHRAAAVGTGSLLDQLNGSRQEIALVRRQPEVVPCHSDAEVRTYPALSKVE